MTADEIQPSWSVFEECGRCGAAVGAPCMDMRTWPVTWPHKRTKPLRNPHPGRKKVAK